ncbi:MAG: hypothetical protein ACTHM6_18310 [Tepidisphaeraceae bacterium]
MATPHLASARSAIQSEIAFLKSEQARLAKVLELLGGEGRPADIAMSGTTGKKRGRKPKALKAAAAEADLNKALELIKDAGKDGIKAIKLAHELKKSGHTPVGKVPLLSSEKVKMTGKGGGSTYAYVG